MLFAVISVMANPGFQSVFDRLYYFRYFFTISLSSSFYEFFKIFKLVTSTGCSERGLFLEVLVRLFLNSERFTVENHSKDSFIIQSNLSSLWNDVSSFFIEVFDGCIFL